MSDRNPEYDFKWCPGCGDFGVKRALEQAIDNYTEEYEIPRTSNVIVAGIGCSGNMVHMMDGEQPFGIHGIHGRTLPIAFGVATSRPDLNTIIVAGDGDFLSNTYFANNGNSELGSRMINWLNNDDDFILIPSKTIVDAQLKTPFIILGVIGTGFLFLVPLIFIAIGIMIQIRRKKQ